MPEPRDRDRSGRLSAGDAACTARPYQVPGGQRAGAAERKKSDLVDQRPKPVHIRNVKPVHVIFPRSDRKTCAGNAADSAAVRPAASIQTA